MILIVGGSGTLGTEVARLLATRGQPATILSRDPALHRDRFPDSIKFHEGDLTDRASIVAAVRGKSQIIAAAHSIFGRGRAASRYVDDLGHRHLVHAAASANVARFIYVSAWCRDEHADNPFFAAKRRVERSIRESGLVFTIVRPTAFMDVHAEQLIGKKVHANERLLVLGPGTAPRNFVAAGDVARVVADSARDNSNDTQTITVAGPQNLSTNDVVAVYEDLLATQARITRLPLAAASLMAITAKPLHPGVSQVLDIATRVERDGDGFSLGDHPESSANMSLEDWARSRVSGW